MKTTMEPKRIEQISGRGVNITYSKIKGVIRVNVESDYNVNN